MKSTSVLFRTVISSALAISMASPSFASGTNTTSTKIDQNLSQIDELNNRLTELNSTITRVNELQGDESRTLVSKTVMAINEHLEVTAALISLPALFGALYSTINWEDEVEAAEHILPDARYRLESFRYRAQNSLKSNVSSFNSSLKDLEISRTYLDGDQIKAIQPIEKRFRDALVKLFSDQQPLSGPQLKILRSYVDAIDMRLMNNHLKTASIVEAKLSQLRAKGRSKIALVGLAIGTSATATISYFYRHGNTSALNAQYIENNAEQIAALPKVELDSKITEMLLETIQLSEKINQLKDENILLAATEVNSLK